MRKQIPNFITLINLFCGCCALISVFHNEFLMTFWFLFFGGLADYMDGMVARWLDVKSPLGKELDSMADMVSFGVVPGAILYALLGIYFVEQGASKTVIIPALPAFILSMAACMRLAKFNLDTRQTEHFLGMPTPAVTMFITGLMLIYHDNFMGLKEFVIQPWFLYLVTLIFSYIMLAELPMFSLKFKGFKWKGNEIKFIFLFLTFAMLPIFKGPTFAIMILLYLITSIVLNITGKSV